MFYARQSTDQWTGRSPDQTSLIASLLRYGGGTVAQRMENHRASSLSPSTNEDRFLQHESTEGIGITDNVVSAATNITTPQHKYARQSTDQQTSQSPDQTSLIASLLSYGVGTVSQRTENHSASSLSPSTNEDRFLQHTSTKGIDITDNAVSAATNVTTPQHNYARQSPDQRTSQSPDQTSLLSSLLSYGVGTVAQRMENHSASSLSPSTNEDRFLQHASTEGIDITDNAVSAATNVTTPQHKIRTASVAACRVRFGIRCAHAPRPPRLPVAHVPRAAGGAGARPCARLRAGGALAAQRAPLAAAIQGVFRRDATGKLVGERCVAEERVSCCPRGGRSALRGALEVRRHVPRHGRAHAEFSNMTAENCGGYKLLPASAFYPIYYSRWRRYFQEEGAEQTLAEVRGSIGVHVWNALSHDEPVHTHSKQPYAQLARQVCPSVVAALNGTM